MRKLSFFTTAFLTLAMLVGCVPHKKEAPASLVTTQRDSTCVKEFNTLSRIDPAAYQLYLTQFTKLDSAYQVYKQNASQMNQDAKDMLGMEMDTKLKIVCARIKSAAFKNMEKRAQDVNGI